MTHKTATYCCIDPTCNQTVLQAENNGLKCPNGHFYPFVTGTKIPVFATLDENSNEYSHSYAAEIHDNCLDWLLATFKTDEATLRKSLVRRIGLTAGERILIIGAGAGNELPYLVEELSGKGEIYAQDIAKQMLLSAHSRHVEKLQSKEIKIFLSLSDATRLPFTNGFFDAAYHFGGINLFSDIAKSIGEMNRVVKSGGNVVFGDEGLAPWLLETETGQMLIKNNPLYAYSAPLKDLPATARGVKLSWELGNCFYVIQFEAHHEPLPIDIDIPHKGKRGGTIRSRYFGQLEGVDPALRDLVYQAAEKHNTSRVAFLESALRAALNQEK